MRPPYRPALLIAALALVAGFAVAQEEPQSLRFVQTNVWSGLNYAGVFSAGEFEPDAAREFRFSLLQEQLSALAPDVVAVNEANPLPAYAEMLAAALEMDFISHWRMAGVRVGVVGLPVNLREGDAILADSELGLVQSGRLGLSGGPAGELAAFQLSEANQVLAGKLSAAGRELFVFVTRWHASPFASHRALSAKVDGYSEGELEGRAFVSDIRRAVEGSARRMAELEKTLVFINEIAGKAPVVLMGSLNIQPDSDEAARLREAGFVDAHAAATRAPGATWNPEANLTLAEYPAGPWPEEQHRLDYIWVRGSGLAIQRAGLVLTESTYGVHPSNRFGVFADILVQP